MFLVLAEWNWSHSTSMSLFLFQDQSFPLLERGHVKCVAATWAHSNCLNSLSRSYWNEQCCPRARIRPQPLNSQKRLFQSSLGNRLLLISPMAIFPPHTVSSPIALPGFEIGGSPHQFPLRLSSKRICKKIQVVANFTRENPLGGIWSNANSECFLW